MPLGREHVLCSSVSLRPSTVQGGESSVRVSWLTAEAFSVSLSVPLLLVQNHIGTESQMPITFSLSPNTYLLHWKWAPRWNTPCLGSHRRRANGSTRGHQGFGSTFPRSLCMQGLVGSTTCLCLGEPQPGDSPQRSTCFHRKDHLCSFPHALCN